MRYLISRPDHRRDLSSEPFLDAVKPLRLAAVDEREFCFGVLKEVRKRLDLALWIERNADRSTVKDRKVCKRPRRMIFPDQDNAIAFAFLTQPVRKRMYKTKRLTKGQRVASSPTIR